MTDATIALSPGRTLYHDVWTQVGAKFYDRNRLAAIDWLSWRDRFNDSLTDVESALPRIDEMLAALNDRYTSRVKPSACAAGATSPSPIGSPSQADVHTPAAEDDSVLGVIRPDGLGYLRIMNFDTVGVAARVLAAAQKISACKGYVLDLRNNGGGMMHEAFLAQNCLVIDGTLATLEMYEEGGLLIRQYNVTPKEFFCSVTEPDGTKREEHYERLPCILGLKPLVVLINGKTASAAETTAIATIQNCLIGAVSIVGSGKTRAKGIGQAPLEFADGAVEINVSHFRCICPGGEWVGDGGQTVSDGIEPEVFVENDHGVEGVQAAFTELRKLIGEAA